MKLPINSKRGALLITVLIFAAMLSFMALSLMPDEYILREQARDKALSTNLSNIREAADMALIFPPSDPEWTAFEQDLSSDKIEKNLEILSKYNYLRPTKHLYDAHMPTHLQPHFNWHVSENLISDSSFEAKENITNISKAWKIKSSDIPVLEVIKANSINKSLETEHYPLNNSMGNFLSGKNNSTAVWIKGKPTTP
ncbi:MAG: type II secretion system protein [Candidatus Riflebacteria bacterium]|nr:type II secretion system protein [Candidatus Riflebacteria bacterium]